MATNNPQLTCFAITVQDPENLNRVYVLFGGGGIWRTDNFYDTPLRKPEGTKWTPLTDKLPNNGGAMAFGRTSQVLYYAIGVSAVA
jgi:hypothetical protein